MKRSRSDGGGGGASFEERPKQRSDGGGHYSGLSGSGGRGGAVVVGGGGGLVVGKTSSQSTCSVVGGGGGAGGGGGGGGNNSCGGVGERECGRERDREREKERERDRDRDNRNRDSRPLVSNSPSHRVVSDVSACSRGSTNTANSTETATAVAPSPRNHPHHPSSLPPHQFSQQQAPPPQHQQPQQNYANGTMVAPSSGTTSTSAATTITATTPTSATPLYSSRFISHARPLTLADVIQEPIDTVSAKLRDLPTEFHESLKGGLRDMLGGGVKGRDELMGLQSSLKGRSDITKESLSRADRTQLEIIVAVRTGIPVYLLQEVNITPTFLIEIYFNERCRNVACLTVLPADGCKCAVCKTPGFCNLCMCVVCCKFDFDANTCRWIGCDFCCHWCHTDCALSRENGGQVHIASSTRQGKTPEQEFRCPGCNHTSELFGFVKDVFQLCASAWQSDVLRNELQCVQRIFGNSKGEQGVNLYNQVGKALIMLERDGDKDEVVKDMARFFEGGEGGTRIDHPRLANGEADLVHVDTHETPTRRIAEVVRDAVSKMEADVKAKTVDLKRARNYLEMYDRELEEKQRDARELSRERQQKKQQIEELETIVRLKKAEADMFQMRADEARREADGLSGIVKAKSERLEVEFTDRYKKLRLEDAESKRKTLYDLVQGLEKAKEQADTTKMDLLGSIQELLRMVDAPKEAVK